MIAKQYFLAANGYSGFRSYFDNEFNSEKYTKIYVLKGGPGTGKSSLMKKLCATANPFTDKTEEILCSSDPKSLDGIIISKNDKKIAILDGTNPHERDAVIPGAVDELVDLGKGWNKKILEAQRENILELNKQKKFSYKKAYSYLSVSGAINKEVVKAIKNIYIDNNRNLGIKTTAESFCKINTRLISAFCKHNIYTLDTLKNSELTKVPIKGEEEICYLFMNKILSQAKLYSREISIFPSPLDGAKNDAILIHDTDTLYLIGDGDNSIDLTDCFINDKVEVDNINRLKALETETLSEASRWFNIASDFHFRLEEIYSRAMDFSVIDDITDSLSKEILDILEK